MHPRVPRSIRIVLVLATTASLLALPSLASAAPKGSELSVVVTTPTPEVSPNMNGAFEVVVTNGGKASLTHASLTVTVSDGGTLQSVPAECGSDGVCDLGTLVSTDVRTLLFVVRAPAAGSVELRADLRVDAGSDNPSRDATSGAGSISVNASTTFFGAWQSAGNALTGGIDNGHQSAVVNVPAVVFDYPAKLTESNSRVCGQKGIGQALGLQFARGEPLSSPLVITVTYDDVARGNRTPGNVGFVHQNDSGQCTFLVPGCETAGCFTANWDSNGPNKKLLVVAYLGSNGIVKGF